MNSLEERNIWTILFFSLFLCREVLREEEEGQKKKRKKRFIYRIERECVDVWAWYACACHVSVFPPLQVYRNWHIYPQTAAIYLSGARLQGRVNIGIFSEAMDWCHVLFFKLMTYLTVVQHEGMWNRQYVITTLCSLCSCVKCGFEVTRAREVITLSFYWVYYCSLERVPTTLHLRISALNSKHMYRLILINKLSNL